MKLFSLLLAAAMFLLSGLAAGAQDPAIRTVVIDPGHGGMETGAKGRFGNLEKDITLAISLKLKALLEKELGFEAVLTRDRDVDVPTETRSAIANNHKAALFISIHANGSVQRKAAGSETFFLSLNATDEESRKLAYEENTAAGVDKRIVEDDKDLVKMILWDMAQSAYVKQSSRLAELVQRELNALLGTENRGIKQANFAVLRGVACPAILVEAAFISNPEEEQLLVDDGFQSRVAEAVYRGLAAYLKLLRQD
jgi:N-acetylmuramoyl-L-alanine amidase